MEGIKIIGWQSRYGRFAGLGRPGLPGGKQWWYVFGVGVALGCVVFGMRLFLAEASANGGEAAKPAAEARMYGPESAQEAGRLTAATDSLMADHPGKNENGGAGQALPESHHISGDERGPVSGADKADKPSGAEAPAKSGGGEAAAAEKQPEAAIGNGVAATGAAGGAGNSGAASQAAATAANPSALEGVNVRVYLSDSGSVEKVPIETYVMGVLAGEMPIDFELEALKAQAIAARTYIVRRLASGDNELASRGADVGDTVRHQVYVSKKELAGRWSGEEKEANLAKLEQAVRETKGLVVTYKGEPIEAVFFSTSNGFTENSEEYWALALPYLRSVDSPWDKELSPRYEQQATFKVSRFYSAMGLSGKAASAKNPSMKVTARTDGNRIKSLSINGKTFTGREVRERLGLASSEFGWKIGKGSITFTTYGLGHGVGMSQWGANGLAKEGGSAADILLHYYTGTKVEQASKLPAR